MRARLSSLSSLVLKLILPLTAFLLPLVFFPTTSDSFFPHKQLVLMVIALAATLAWAIQNVLRGQIRLAAGPALIPSLLLALVYLISTYWQTPNTIEALRGPVTTIVSLVLILIATSSTLASREHLKKTFLGLFLALIIVSLVQLLAFAGLGQALGVNWLVKAFNPVGGPLPLITLALVTVPGALYLGLKSQATIVRLIGLASAVLGVLAALVALSLLTPGSTPLALLPVSAGWAIAVDGLKSWRTALFGTGPGTFTTAFNLLKPLSLNATPLWGIPFASSSNELLTILTTTGILGLGAYLWAIGATLAKAVRAKIKHPESTAVRISLAVALVFQFLLPSNLVLTSIIFILLALAAIDLKHEGLVPDLVISFFAARIVKAQASEPETPKAPKRTEILPWLFLLLAIGLVIFAFWLQLPAYAAKTAYFQSLQAAAANNGTKTYNLQIQAVSLNPYDPVVRMAYSQTNLALANAIAARGNLSDQDRDNIAKLVQQAIREAKAATVLDPHNSLSWANLARIYRQLINSTEGAKDWTIASFTRAIQLEPTNPQLRLELGAIYFAQKDWDRAITLFSQATTLKPDWANGHYNLAAAYKEKKDYDKAAAELRGVLKLLDIAAPDYAKAQEELANLELKLKDKAATGSAVLDTDTKSSDPLSTPTPIPSVAPIQLPDEAGLNLTPTPTP